MIDKDELKNQTPGFISFLIYKALCWAGIGFMLAVGWFFGNLVVILIVRFFLVGGTGGTAYI